MFMNYSDKSNIDDVNSIMLKAIGITKRYNVKVNQFRLKCNDELLGINSIDNGVVDFTSYKNAALSQTDAPLGKFVDLCVKNNIPKFSKVKKLTYNGQPINSAFLARMVDEFYIVFLLDKAPKSRLIGKDINSKRQNFFEDSEMNSIPG